MTEATLRTGSGVRLRLRHWARATRLTRKLAVLLAGAALTAGIATHLAWTRAGPQGPDPDTVLILLNLDLILLLFLVAIVLRRLVALWIERRRGQAGARLHARLVGLFSIVAITPTIVVAVFSAYFLNFGLESWFSERVRTALTESVAVADAYYTEHRQAIRADALAMGRDISRNALTIGNDVVRFSLFLESQATLRDLTEAVVFSSDGRILARTGLAFSVILEPIKFDTLSSASSGEVILLESDTEDRVRALLRLDNFVDAYLIIGRFIDARVLTHVSQVHEATDQYMLLEGKRYGLQLVFALIYVVVALLLLFAAVWVGLNFAGQLAGPIVALVAAAERVRAGDLTARVVEPEGRDELGTLSRTFNRMTDQLDGQRRELMEATRQIDARRRFTESVLTGVSAGVIGLDRDGRIELPNRSALRLLDVAAVDAVGRALADVVPEMADLLATARWAPDGLAEDQIELTRGRRSMALIVRITREEGGLDAAGGYVVTFDDITALVAAQRTAAWADVARRIAHEIKNPLTPIQLAAERLKRKYLKQIVDDPDAFILCTDTIVRQVGDLRRMVDEFSGFARMPAPTFADEPIHDVVIEALALQEVAHPAIAFVRELPDPAPVVSCDRRQIVQVLINLLQNAIDAIEGRAAPADPGRVIVRVLLAQSAVVIEVEDNGRGLPPGSRDRLLEPYVTARAKGTGLGLAIVNRIVQDHGGVLTLDDAEGGGACARVVLPLRRHEGIANDRKAT
ncbi:MAG: PAS domain-containing sensor histidine kinase [Alphaproteobacteria bacterium]|nr:PAS domain-containing sensor histidine kinase [Alphaproteobacteria bacterium]